MEEVIKELALKYNKDIRVTKAICEHPLLFVKHMIESPDNIRAIMIRYLGKFVPKNKKTIEDKQLNVAKHLQRKSIAKL
jgi:hypothetical protein